MSRIAFINAVPYGSTGKILQGIARMAEEQGHQTFTYYAWTKILPKAKANNVFVGAFLGRVFHLALGKITGFAGLFSIIDTLRLIHKLKAFRPDVLNLHNLHGFYLNLPLLFSYIKKSKVRVVWTLHDCWALTAQCVHFTIAKCDKWKTGCYNCPQYKNYPGTLIDQTKTMWKLKKKWFSGIGDMLIVTPSQWLADLAQQSFLQSYPIQVIHNGIDLNIFFPRESNFRETHNCKDKFIILGVAYGWGYRKGLDVFLELAKRLDDRYQIVLVGTDEEIDKQLSPQIISIHRTQNQVELCELYSEADLFVNPTREENYPTVNMEAVACGTPVLTFRTGGSPEMLDDTCGSVVSCDDISALEQQITYIHKEKPFTKDACVKHANAYNMNHRFAEYIELFL